MSMRGHVHNGVVVPERPGDLPEGAVVQIELVPPQQPPATPASAGRPGGQWKGQVIISADFDELPDDLAEAFGMRLP